MAKEKKRLKKLNYSSLDLLVYIWSNRIPLLIISGVALVISTITSFMITPLFKSEVILFPTSGTSVSRIISSESYSGRQNFYELGEEEQAEKLLQILNSSEIRDRIIEKHDLVSHYGFKDDAKYLRTRLTKRFNSNVKFRQTPYRSVVIQVMDKDPLIAASMANDIAELIDTVFHRIINDRAREALYLVEKEYIRMEKRVSDLKDSIVYFNRMGIHDYESQAERYYEAYGKAIVEGNMEAARVIDNRLRQLSIHGAGYLDTRQRLILESERLSLLMQRHSEAKFEYEQTVPHKFVVDRAQVADKKAYPKKSLIIIISVLSAFLMALIILLVLDNIRPKLMKYD